MSADATAQHPNSRYAKLALMAAAEFIAGGEVLARCRRRSELTQAQLASRLGTTASAVSRWERGHVEATFDTVQRAAATCGVSLAAVLREPAVDQHDVSLLESTLALTATERLRRLVGHVRFVEAARDLVHARCPP